MSNDRVDKMAAELADLITKWMNTTLDDRASVAEVVGVLECCKLEVYANVEDDE